MSYYLENSTFGYDGRFHIFSPLPVDASIKEHVTVSYRPIAPLAHQEVVEFIIPPMAQYYVDLSRTKLRLGLRITDNKGEVITAADRVGLINYPLNTIFRSMEFSIQQREITASVGSNYAYKAVIDTLLNKDPAELKSSLQASGFFPDTPSFMDHIEVEEANQGLMERWVLTRNGAIAHLEGELHIDTMLISQFLPNGLGFKLRLFPARDVFCLMHDSVNSYQIQLTSATLDMQYIIPTNDILIAHSNAIEKSPAIYSFERSNIKSWVIPSGLTTWSIDSMFADECPNELVIAMVSSKAYTGDSGSNPFNFQHFNLEHLSFQIENFASNSAIFNPDFSKNQYTKEFLSLYGPENKNVGNVTYTAFGNGYTLYKVKLDKGVQANHTTMSRRAQTRLSFRFRVALPEAVVVIAYGKFNSTLQIDRSRNVYIT